MFPEEVERAVGSFLPGWRLPGAADLKGDWGHLLDRDSLIPVLCRGDFLGTGQQDYAFFVLRSDPDRYKLVVLTGINEDQSEVFHLTEGMGSPNSMYVFPIEPGNYKISRIIWKHGGPKMLELSQDGVNVGTYESASCVYYWHEAARRFVEQWMTD
jgi:hypothetical protein